MEIKEYQLKSTRTMNKALTKEQSINNMIAGIFGEGGEVADIIKKHLYQGHELDREHLEEEIGDLMFYIVNFATIFDLDMERVLDKNVTKLTKRYKKGFTVQESINRTI